MSVSGRRELARSRSAAYLKAPKARKSAMLDEFVAATSVNRKTAMFLLRNPPAVKAKSRGRPKKRYGTDVAAALEMLWALTGYICSERLVPFLPGLVEMVLAEGAWGFSQEVQAKLGKISVSTCDRLLRPHRTGHRCGQSLTRPGTMLKSQIPIRTWADWSETEPGYCEMDLVHHCDNDTSGEYLHTLTITDVLLGWTEIRALKNRSETTVRTGVESIGSQMPYKIKGLDSDSGAEFINHIMLRYCQDSSIVFTRSRPNKKNDQCRVEQKNYSVVRVNVGYDRFEGEEACKALNAFYRVLRLHVNFLQPCMMLVSKERKGSRIVKKHDIPKTPCQRALDHPCVSEETKQALREQLAAIRPMALNKDLHRLRDILRRHAR